MNKKSAATLILSAIVAGVVVSWTNANMFDFTDDNSKTEMRSNFAWIWWSMFGNHFKKWVNWNMKWLTDEEKTSLETMSDDEKKAFFEQKRTEKQAEMEAKNVERKAHEAVIDKLIDGTVLTDDEKIILEDIKVKRAERKALSAQREAKMEEMKAIMDKKIAWEELTEEEETKLDEFRVNSRGWMWRKEGFMHR